MGFFFFGLLGLVGFEFDPRPLGQVTQGILKIPAFLLHHELENIAAFPALTEAMPGLPIGGDDK